MSSCGSKTTTQLCVQDTSGPRGKYRPDGFESHHVITLAFLPLQVLLCVLQLVWDQAQFGLHVVNDVLELSLGGEDTLTDWAARLPLLRQLADELRVHGRGSCQHR